MERAMLNRRHLLAAAATSLVAGPGLTTRARAQAVKKTVHIIVGFPAGGGTDVMARVIAEALRDPYRRRFWSRTRPAPARDLPWST
jgi:tripartite-type tricarboxylate transporter receptor subunit TctC